MAVKWTNKMPKFDEPTEDDAPGNILHIITYAQGKYRQLYLDVPQVEARQRFERWMVRRNRFEIMIEGWDAIIESIRLVNGEAWLGDIGADLRLMSDLMARAATMQGQAA